jgi:hypothetical protein
LAKLNYLHMIIRRHEIDFGSLVLFYREPVDILRKVMSDSRAKEFFVARGVKLFNSQGTYK